MKLITKKISRKHKKVMALSGLKLKSLVIENKMLKWMESKRSIATNGSKFLTMSHKLITGKKMTRMTMEIFKTQKVFKLILTTELSLFKAQSSKFIEMPNKIMTNREVLSTIRSSQSFQMLMEISFIQTQ